MNKQSVFRLVLAVFTIAPISFAKATTCGSLFDSSTARETREAVLGPAFQRIRQEPWKIEDGHLFEIRIRLSDEMSTRAQAQTGAAILALLRRHRLVETYTAYSGLGGYFYQGATNFEVKSAKLERLHAILLNSPEASTISEFSIVEPSSISNRQKVVRFPRIASEDAKMLYVDASRVSFYLRSPLPLFDGNHYSFVFQHYKPIGTGERLRRIPQSFYLPAEIEIRQAYPDKFAKSIEDAAAAAVARAMEENVDLYRRQREVSNRLEVAPDRVWVIVENLMVAATADIPHEVLLHVHFEYNANEGRAKRTLVNTYGVHISDFAVSQKPAEVKNSHW